FPVQVQPFVIKTCAVGARSVVPCCCHGCASARRDHAQKCSASFRAAFPPREHMEAVMPAYWATVGRIILGLFFLSSGVAKIIGEPMAMQETIRHGFPMVTTLYWAAAILETVGGGALLLGIATAWSAALLALFTLLAAFTIHDFWNNPVGSMERLSN